MWLMFAAHRRDFFNTCTEVTAILPEHVFWNVTLCQWGTTYPLIQHNISEDSYLQQHHCANLK